LRKKVAEVKQPNYLENVIQSTLDAVPELKGGTLVLGGDGRYYNDVAIQVVIKLAAGNGVRKVLVAKDGIFATPAVSATIRARKCTGGIILTASHNPGGPENDFGVKYNVSNGGPAPEKVTDSIYARSLKIDNYRLATIDNVDVSKVGIHEWEGFTVEVIDAMTDYVSLFHKIFNFEEISKLLKRPDFKCLFDSLHGVNGPFSKRIFVEELGGSNESLRGCPPLPDFGGGHPDPNLVYAHDLVTAMYSKDVHYDFGCAWDGDGDRNMVMGKDFFVTPSDSVAIIAAYATSIPHYKSGLKAVSRSMPTSGALDRVADKLGIPLYEVPTGCKFFGNLMDKYESEGSEGFICGEESFGTGSAHIREKDGTWAVLCWLSILASKNNRIPVGQPLISVADIVKDHWKTYGRNYYCRYDYEGVSSSGADKMMAHLVTVISSAKPGDKMGQFTLTSADEFEYKDPVDGSISSHQGIRFIFSDGSRIIIRLSGTGSAGATIRLYLEQYEPANGNHEKKTTEGLGPLITVALQTMKLKEFIGTEEPTVIT
jgi:phosphoglucomutase